MGVPTKFPTIFGIIFVFVIVGAIIYVTEHVFRTPGRASGSTEPKNIHITNITDTSFTVLWETGTPATGALLVTSPGKTNRIYYDERDTGGKTLGTYTSHSVSVRDGKPDTSYTISLLSNGQKSETEEKIRTPQPLPPNTGGLEPAYGTVLTSTSDPANDAIVYLTVEGGQELSTIVKPSGLWLIPLNQVRTRDFTSYLPVLERMTESLVVRLNDAETTAVTDTLNDSPVPDMTMGNTYDFRRQQAKTAGSVVALRPNDQKTPTGGTVLGNTVSKIGVFALTSPAQDAALATTLPYITGTGVPDKYVGISIGITNPVSTSTKIRPDGMWAYTPSRPLPWGKQSITVSSVDQQGKPIAITHTFQILKSGTQVLGDATPSATLSPAATGSATPTPTETVVTVPESTLAGQEVPTSGSMLPTITLLILGLSLLGGGGIALLGKRS